MPIDTSSPPLQWKLGSISPNSRYMTAALRGAPNPSSWEETALTVFFDSADGSLRRVSTDAMLWGRFPVFSPNSEWILLASDGGFMTYNPPPTPTWSLVDAKTLTRQTISLGKAGRAQFSPDGAFVVMEDSLQYSQDRHPKLLSWSLYASPLSGGPRFPIEQGTKGQWLALAPAFVLSKAADGRLRLTDLAAAARGDADASRTVPFVSQLNHLSYSPFGTRALVGYDASAPSPWKLAVLTPPCTATELDLVAASSGFDTAGKQDQPIWVDEHRLVAARDGWLRLFAVP